MPIEEKYKSCLKTKLSFKRYVAPKDYSNIRERLELPEDTVFRTVNDTFLSRYLEQEEGLDIGTSNIIDKSGKVRSVDITANKRKMTLEVSVESEKALKPDELLNTLNLHEFILTGKYPERESK